MTEGDDTKIKRPAYGIMDTFDGVIRLSSRYPAKQMQVKSIEKC